jgi:peptidyl-prolyl cis-trans isomerase A (cyclophilin A)
MFVRAASLACFLALAAILVPSQVDAATTVRIAMVGGGSFDIELNDNTPLARDNFLNYVTTGKYADTVFHRSDNSLNVLQGGGFTAPAAGSTNFLDPITTYAPVAYEATLGWSNTIGTIGAARTAAPNSATSQWYINMADNSSILDDAVRPGNGYTVFGKIVAGWDVAQQLFAEKKWDWTLVLGYDGFNWVPLESSFTGGRYPMPDDFLTIQSAQVLPVVLPEPATMALVAVGALAILRRKYGRK